MIEGVKVILPAAANGNVATVTGTRFYQGDVEIKDVSAFSMPTMNVNGILEVTITIPVSKIQYADEVKMSPEMIRDQLSKFRKK